jgi:hypothetical protein
MQPKLRSCNAIVLEFSSTIPLSDEQISKIRDVAHPDKDGDSSFFDLYQGHRTLAIVREAEEKIQEYKIEFTYVARTARKLSKRTPRISQLVKILCLVKEQLNFECSVIFEFGRKLRPKSIISLPMKYIEAPNMPFDRTMSSLKLQPRESCMKM